MHIQATLRILQYKYIFFMSSLFMLAMLFLQVVSFTNATVAIVISFCGQMKTATPRTLLGLDHQGSVPLTLGILLPTITLHHHRMLHLAYLVAMGLEATMDHR